MHSKALISLRGFFHPILRFLGMATTPPTEVEFPCNSGVLEWEKNLLARYRSRDPVSSAPERSRMGTLKVVTIRRFKEKTYAEHEYLVAEVYDPDLGRNRYLRIERFVSDFPQTQDDSIRHNIPTTSSQSSLVLKTFSAVDYVKAIAAWPTGDICLEIVTWQDSPMIALDLAIVAKVVHEYNAQYQALTHQCFWYSAMIVSVLRKSFPQIKVYTLEADHGEEMEFSNKKGGTFKRLQIYSERPGVITEIHNLFETYRAEIYSSVNLLNTGYNILLIIHYLRLRKPHSLLNRKQMQTE
jgi:hypothetical protein